jgi:hypothetical protein
MLSQPVRATVKVIPAGSRICASVWKSTRMRNCSPRAIRLDFVFHRRSRKRYAEAFKIDFYLGFLQGASDG